MLVPHCYKGTGLDLFDTSYIPGFETTILKQFFANFLEHFLYPLIAHCGVANFS